MISFSNLYKEEKHQQMVDKPKEVTALHNKQVYCDAANWFRKNILTL